MESNTLVNNSITNIPELDFFFIDENSWLRDDCTFLYQIMQDRAFYLSEFKPKAQRPTILFIKQSFIENFIFPTEMLELLDLKCQISSSAYYHKEFNLFFKNDVFPL
jgi:hypothetical protein